MGLLSWLLGSRRRQEKVGRVSQVFPIIQTEPQPQFQTVEGRQMLIGRAYVLPKDTEEVNRLDFQHFILRNIIQGNYVAPLARNLRDILDVGSGTGRWAKEMALEFPMARVIGCDLVEQKTEQDFQPSNYRFIAGDILKGLSLPDQSFDFVHQRLLFLGMPATAWPQVIRELVRLTRPGGWIELVETEMAASKVGPAGEKLQAWLVAASRLRGLDTAQVPNLDKLLSDGGLKNTVMRSYPVPIGRWGGRLGTMMSTNSVAAIRGLKPLVVAKLGVNANDYEQMVDAMVQEYEVLHPTLTFYAAIGQRLH